MTKLQAVKKHCLACVGGKRKEVELCDNPIGSEFECQLHAFKNGKNPPKKKLSIKIIKKYCTWCMGGNAREINSCLSPECNLYKFTHLQKRSPTPQ